MAKEKTELVKTENTAVSLADFGEFAGAGLETVTAQDINIPYIQFLQTSSPQIKRVVKKN